MSREGNKALFKTFFSAFQLEITMLALKKLDIKSELALTDLPSQFKLRFKFYNFDWAESAHLYFDPLAPEDSPLVPIFESRKNDKTSHSFSFYVDKHLDRFVEFMESKTLKIGFFGT